MNNPFHTPPPSSLRHDTMGLVPFVGLNNSRGCSRRQEEQPGVPRQGTWCWRACAEGNLLFLLAFFSSISPSVPSSGPFPSLPETKHQSRRLHTALSPSAVLAHPGFTHSTCFKTWLRSILADKSKDVPRTRKKKKKAIGMKYTVSSPQKCLSGG